MPAADIFISYTKSDSEWAHWIHRELKRLGYEAHIYEREIAAGEDFIAWMTERMNAADHVLCVMSEEYLTAGFSALERNAALAHAVAKPGFVLPVVVKRCRVPVVMASLNRCELHDISEEAARERFEKFLADPAILKLIVFPDPRFTAHNIPIRVPEHFLGRDDSLAEIATALARYEGRVAITALHGLRGVGKTTLAAAYAFRHADRYRATWWIRAQTEETMRADLVGLGVRLGWVPADEKEAPALARVMERLGNEDAGILLIYDNAIDGESLRPYLPRGGRVRVLITSNAPEWRSLAKPIQIRIWPKTIGADYLIARTGREIEREAAEALSETLGGLPLAHEQAAAYCERLGVSFGDYLHRFNEAPAAVLDDERHAPADYHDRLTVAKTFTLAIEQAAKLHPAAEPMIVHVALLAPEPIPLVLFAEGRDKLGEPLASALANDGRIEAVAALRAFALVDREEIPDERDPTDKTDCIRLHRLVRDVAAARCSGDARDAMLRGLTEALWQSFPSNVFNEPAAWRLARRLGPIVVEIVERPDERFKGFEAAVSGLLIGLATYRRRALAAYDAAQPLFERALAICENALGPEHPDTATALTNLAGILQAQGETEAAQPLYERALAIREKALGPDHPHTAQVLNNFATLLEIQRDFEAAARLSERALAVRERVLGPEHPDTAASLDTLAGILESQKNLAAARPLYERALAIRQKILGPDHPDTALTINNLAYLLLGQEDFAAAKPLFERALAIREKTLGPEHAETAISLNNLAHVFQSQSDYSSARPLFERALTIFERAPGPDHPITALGLNNLGRLLQLQGELLAARPLYERALAIREKALGPDHPITAQSLNNLAGLLESQGDVVAARPLYERALAILEKALGPDHPNTKTVAANLAALPKATGAIDC